MQELDSASDSLGDCWADYLAADSVDLSVMDNMSSSKPPSPSYHITLNLEYSEPHTSHTTYLPPTLTHCNCTRTMNNQMRCTSTLYKSPLLYTMFQCMSSNPTEHTTERLTSLTSPTYCRSCMSTNTDPMNTNPSTLRLTRPLKYYQL